MECARFDTTRRCSYRRHRPTGRSRGHFVGERTDPDALRQGATGAIALVPRARAFCADATMHAVLCANLQLGQGLVVPDAHDDRMLLDTFPITQIVRGVPAR